MKIGIPKRIFEGVSTVCAGAWLALMLDETANQVYRPTARLPPVSFRPTRTDDRLPNQTISLRNPTATSAGATPLNAETVHPILAGRRALVVGIANEHSIGYGCAKAFGEIGAEIAITY